MAQQGASEAAAAWRHVSFSGRLPSPVPSALRESPSAGRLRRARSGGDGQSATSRLDPFVVWVLERADLDPGAYRPDPLNRRLPACLRALRCESPGRARSALIRSPELLHRAVDALLVGVTSFGRDPQVFDSLARLALPRLRDSAGVLRVWSAGCANGAELYSMAALLESAGMLRDSLLLGTDCRVRAIAEARHARYDPSTLGPFAGSAGRHSFEPQGALVRPLPALRAGTAWKVADVTRSVEEGPWHIVLCRNVAIYLSRSATDRLWPRLVDELADGGFLVTGKADHRPPGMERLAPCLYRKP